MTFITIRLKGLRWHLIGLLFLLSISGCAGLFTGFSPESLRAVNATPVLSVSVDAGPRVIASIRRLAPANGWYHRYSREPWLAEALWFQPQPEDKTARRIIEIHRYQNRDDALKGYQSMKGTRTVYKEDGSEGNRYAIAYAQPRMNSVHGFWAGTDASPDIVVAFLRYDLVFAVHYSGTSNSDDKYVRAVNEDILQLSMMLRKSMESSQAQ